MKSAREAVHVPVPVEAVADFCRRHRVRELALFGSVLRDDFTDHSDVDVLIDFMPDTRITLFGLSRLQTELEAMFRRDVDLVMKDTLKRRIAAEVLASREVLYVASQ
ncbi:MAG: nucleotidyltransferase domain-containing protein [Thermaerobacter sp.]|nr:nucleotidyltransferase domain-containing protein [Thermaerobacter sp.]